MLLLLIHSATLESPALFKHSESAVKVGTLGMVQDFLDAGAEVNATSFCEYGSSALEVALAKKGGRDDEEYEEILLLILIVRGADFSHAMATKIKN